ncbi:M20/M25/M40 family metallo-hydrolase [bacterium]|nr:M20/M25/M40 family metallo-hydrolase [bacterium]
MKDIEQYIEENRLRFLDELFVFLRQPSISARDEGVRECAVMLAGMLEQVGAETRIMETARHPVVYGEILREDSPTVLIYGHYDVQPPEPLEAWDSPPFEPEIRDGRIYGRGTSDNKAQLFTYLKAAEILKECFGQVPLSFRFLFEGEEEIGSPNLKSFVNQHKDLLDADLVLCSDSHLHESGRPIVILGLKGMLYVELRTRGALSDQHSKMAATLPNPAWELVWLLSSLKDRDNRVTMPGFYDSVRELTDLERSAVGQIPRDDEALLSYYGVEAFLPGRNTRDFHYNMIAEPTCNIAGFLSGYTGSGAKTVLPAEALVKLDFRLVPDQRPEEILEKLRTHLNNQDFGGVEIAYWHGIDPSRTPIDHPAVEIIKDSISEVFGTAPIVYPNIGGSGPNYIFTEDLGRPCFVIPYATYDQNNHAPNENMDLENFFKGIRTAAILAQNLAKAL